MIRAVIFDIDNTLYDYDRANRIAYPWLRNYARERLNIPADRFDQLHAQAVAQVEAGLGIPCGAMHSRVLRYQLLLEGEGLPLCPHVLEMARGYWEQILAVMEPAPGLTECLAALKGRGLRLGAGTDMTAPCQLEKLTRLGVLPYLDFLVTSEEVAAEKPAAKLFLRCAQKAGVPPEECLFVGDHLEKDVTGAAGVGMQALWYQPDPAQRARRQEIPSVGDFFQLRDLLLEGR